MDKELDYLRDNDRNLRLEVKELKVDVLSRTRDLRKAEK